MTGRQLRIQALGNINIVAILHFDDFSISNILTGSRIAKKNLNMGLLLCLERRKSMTPFQIHGAINMKHDVGEFYPFVKQLIHHLCRTKCILCRMHFAY